jgi:cell division septation protein DedD
VLKSSRVASQTQDDGFHEIQLNGKQLVFLFMAATVVSVVIFLCGVLVGRGVNAGRVTGAEAAALNEPPTADPVITSTQESVIAPGQDPTIAPAPPNPAADDLSYPNRLERSGAPDESMAPAASKPAAAKPTTSNPAQANRATSKPAAADAPAPAPQKEAPVAATPAPAPGSGFAVQVAALNVRSEADAIARRLTAKGYAAYVQAPSKGTAAVYRVRIGTFKTKREADTVAARLKKEEQFTPWVTR